MNDTEQNKALAEWLGWTEIRVLLGDLKGVPPADWKGDTDSAGQAWVPDFGKDLNVMHKAEAIGVVAQHLEMDYREILGDVCGQYQSTWHATAAQRREALLRTLNIYKP